MQTDPNKFTYYWKCDKCGYIVEDYVIFLINHNCDKCNNHWANFLPVKEDKK